MLNKSILTYLIIISFVSIKAQTSYSKKDFLKKITKYEKQNQIDSLSILGDLFIDSDLIDKNDKFDLLNEVCISLRNKRQYSLMSKYVFEVKKYFLQNLSSEKLAEHYYTLSIHFFFNQEFDSTIKYSSQAIYLDSTESKYYNYYIASLGELSKIKEALEKGFQAIGVNEKFNNSKVNKAILYHTIAVIYSSKQNMDEQLYYDKQVANISKEVDLPYELVFLTYKGITDQYIRKNQNEPQQGYLDSAKKYRNELLIMASDSLSNLAFETHQTYADYLFFFKDYKSKDEILYHINKSLDLEPDFYINPNIYISVLNYYGNIDFNADSLRKYIEYADSKLAPFPIRRKISFNYIFYEAYKTMGDSKNALIYYLRYDYLKDSVEKENNLKDLGELQIRYETEKTEIENTSLRKEKKLLQYRLFMTLGLALIFFLLIVLVFINLRRIKAKGIAQKEKIENQKELIRDHLEQLEKQNRQIRQLKEKESIDKSEIEYITNLIHTPEVDNQKWSKIILAFNTVFPNYLEQQREKASEKLTPNDERLSILLKLNYSSQQIADILFVSIHAVNKSRQRLNKKMKSLPV